jgi:hypothetical protein
VGDDQSLILPPEAEFELRFLTLCWAVLPGWFLCLTEFHCASEVLTPTRREDKSPFGSSCPLVPCGIFSWWSGGCTPVTREVINHHLQNPGRAPKKYCGNLKLRYGTLRQFSRKQHFNVLEQTQWTRVQSLSPENRILTLYTLASRLQKQKAKFIPHMAAYDFIGCFISYVTFSSNFLSFICLHCHLFPLPHYQNTACLFLFWSSTLHSRHYIHQQILLAQLYYFVSVLFGFTDLLSLLVVICHRQKCNKLKKRTEQIYYLEKCPVQFL